MSTLDVFFIVVTVVVLVFAFLVRRHDKKKDKK